MEKFLREILIPGFVKDGEKLSGTEFLQQIIPVDGYLGQRIKLPRTTTSYPIQTGANITDFSKRRQPEINLQCILADSVIGIWNVLTGIVEPKPGRKEELLKKILELHESDTLFSINTSMGIFDNCLGEFDFSFDPEDEDTIKFDVQITVNWFAPFAEQQSPESMDESVLDFGSPVKNLGRTTPRPLEII